MTKQQFDWQTSTDVEALTEHFEGLEAQGKRVEGVLVKLSELEDLRDQVECEELEEGVKETREQLSELQGFFEAHGMRVGLRAGTLARELTQNPVFVAAERDEASRARKQQQQRENAQRDARAEKRAKFDLLNGERCTKCGGPMRLWENSKTGRPFLGCEWFYKCNNKPPFNARHRELLAKVGLR